MAKRLHSFGALLLVAFGGLIAATSMPSCQGTCTTSSDCGGDEFCSIALGSCITSRGAGFCKAKPTDCPTVTKQVCACDGKTYQNECVASLAGQSVASNGACQTSCGNGPCACGGPNNVQCGAGYFCDYPVSATTGCLAANAVGTCTPVPKSCSSVSKPVCGCDGKTYANTCDAALAGTAVASATACSCSQTSDCGKDTFCDFPTGSCQNSNPSGSCQAVPMDCAMFVGNPVCGCDGKTYANLCEASKASVSVLSNGPCPCGGPDQIQCAVGEYCLLAAGGCLTPYPAGVCTTPPGAGTCSKVKSPVCGCDGKNYDNACFAAVAGQSVSLNAVCP